MFFNKYCACIRIKKEGSEWFSQSHFQDYAPVRDQATKKLVRMLTAACSWAAAHLIHEIHHSGGVITPAILIKFVDVYTKKFSDLSWVPV